MCAAVLKLMRHPSQRRDPSPRADEEDGGGGVFGELEGGGPDEALDLGVDLEPFEEGCAHAFEGFGWPELLAFHECCDLRERRVREEGRGRVRE
eukprot:1727607-Rhodomonas_salina.1